MAIDLEKIKALSTQKLIDIVKNYQQYGYNPEVRDYSLKILEERGVDKEQLRLTGNLENYQHKSAQNIYADFKKSSTMAFICYGILIISGLLNSIFQFQAKAFIIGLSVLMCVSLILYFVFLIKSFLDQSRFYKSINKVYGASGAFIYLFLGMPLYILMYFYFSKQMKDEMKLIY